MRAFSLLIVGFVACANANWLEDGKEYVFQATGGAASGTMDYSPHSSGVGYKARIRVQASGNKINMKFEDVQGTQYVGAHEPNAWPFDETNYTPSPMAADFNTLSITMNPDGTTDSVTVPSDAPIWLANIMRGWASMMQVNLQKINEGELSFVSKEKTIHGDCNVRYTVAGDKITKSVSHMADCENRRYRMIDDWRGWRCDANPMDTKRQSTEPLYSNTNTVVAFKKSGNSIVPQVIASSGTVMAQFFETEGVSHFAYTNNTLVLVDGPKSSSGDISASGNTAQPYFEFSDEGYGWNQNRDLKAREPFFSTGEYFQDAAADVRTALKGGIMAQKRIMKTVSNDPEAIQRAHKYGINTLLPAFYAMDYDNLKSLFEELKGSDEAASNLFNELLGSAGTTAAAMVVKDMVMANKFNNDRDAARALTAIPFHIRRPNKQLVEEFEELLNYNGDRFIKMAIPLTFGHLVRMTCRRSGEMMSQERRDCLAWSQKYVDQWFEKFRSANNDEDKSEALMVLANMRYGNLDEKLRPVVYGEGEYANLESQLRTDALWASSWDVLMSGKGVEYYMPLFADQTLEHEIRLAAAQLIMYARPTATDLSTMMTTMYTEKDYEVINFVFSLLERWGSSIDPCQKKQGELANYFLKYMRQYAGYETDWGFGVSKTYTRQFQQKKYGYGGSYTFYTIGSKKSTTPISVGMSIGNTVFHSYASNIFSVHLRVQGLAKALVKKFKKMDPATWDMDSLKGVFDSMGVDPREDQHLHVEAIVMLKGVVVIHRHYGKEDTKEGGRLARFFEDLKDMGDEYAITHQRAVQMGAALYEQPTEMGLPMAYMNGITTSGWIDAKVKRGSNRGLLYRMIDYDVNLFTQGVNIMMVHHPGVKASYGIVQDRIYQAQATRSMTVGVNVVKRELNLKVSRPEYDNPNVLMMHSQTSVLVRSATIEAKSNGLQKNCPQCQERVIVSNGEGRQRTIVDRTNKNVGSYMYGEYFDCEMDIDRSNTFGRGLAAFMPYNKNPRTPWTSFMMGLRQIRAFFIYFPRAERCGAMMRWSQSKENPVKEYEVMITGSGEKNGERMFFRGRSIKAKVLIKAIGEPVNRNYKLNLVYTYSPGYLKNEFKALFQRQGASELDMDPYSVCVSYNNQYPDFSDEFMDYDKNTEMSVKGKLAVSYGAVKSCSAAEGKINVEFEHSTTDEAREDLEKKWYYQQCMEEKASRGWSSRDAFPITKACYMTVYDATTARKYKFDVEFEKLTPRLKGIIMKGRTLLKAGLMPYWDADPEEIDWSANMDDEPYMKIEAEFKDMDRLLDVEVKTSQNENRFQIPLSLNWSGRLRNLKFTKTLGRLMKAGIIKPCVANVEQVMTLDNVTYPWTPSSCWTLMSGHCSDTPNFAVFTKKDSGRMATRVYVGGHEVELTPSGAKNMKITVNGSPVSVQQGEQYVHSKDGTEILNIVKWGSTYNVYSFLKVWVVSDGNFVQVIPAPSARGQHCGMCGNFNRDKWDEWTGKDGQLVSSADEMAKSWQYKC